MKKKKKKKKSGVSVLAIIAPQRAYVYFMSTDLVN